MGMDDKRVSSIIFHTARLLMFVCFVGGTKISRYSDVS